MKQFELDLKVKQYMEHENFFKICDEYGCSVGILRYIKSKSPNRTHLPLSYCIEGAGDTVYDAVVDAIQNNA